MAARREFKPMNELTPREAEVLKLKREGHSKKKIAEMLNLGTKTVEGALARAQEKERYK